MDGTLSLDRLLADARERTSTSASFASENSRMIRVDVDGSVWIHPGAVIAYRGDLTFERRPTLDAATLEDALLREAAPLVRAVGKGRLYCAHHGSHTRVVRLDAQDIVVAWDNLAAFESSLDFTAGLVAHGVGLAAGGLVTVRLSGTGTLALGTHGDPIALSVSPGEPVSVDPHAAIAWSTSLTPVLKTDVSWRSAVAHGGSEPVQMLFEGTGTVLAQPFKNAARFQLRAPSLKQIAKLAAV